MKKNKEDWEFHNTVLHFFNFLVWWKVTNFQQHRNWRLKQNEYYSVQYSHIALPIYDLFVITKDFITELTYNLPNYSSSDLFDYL